MKIQIIVVLLLTILSATVFAKDTFFDPDKSDEPYHHPQKKPSKHKNNQALVSRLISRNKEYMSLLTKRQNKIRKLERELSEMSYTLNNAKIKLEICLERSKNRIIKKRNKY